MLFAFNQGEVCTCPSRALVQASIYDAFTARCIDRIKAIKMGSPPDTETMMGAQASKEQLTQDHVLPRSRQAGRRQSAGWRRTRSARRRSRRGLHSADRVRRPQPRCASSRRDLRAGALRSRSSPTKPTHLPLPTTRSWSWCWCVDAQWQHRVPDGSSHQGRRVWTNCYHAAYPAHAAFRLP